MVSKQFDASFQDAYMQLVNRYTTPISAADGQTGIIQAIGTGVRVKINNTYCIITAEHVLGHISELERYGIQIQFAPNEQGCFIDGFGLTTSSTHGESELYLAGSDCDICIIPLGDDPFVEQHDKFFLPSTQLRQKSSTFSDPRIIGVCGYPEKLNDFEAYVNDSVVMKNILFMTNRSLAPLEFARGRFPFYNPNKHIVSLYDCDIFPKGMSGGGVWSVPDFVVNAFMLQHELLDKKYAVEQPTTVDEFAKLVVLEGIITEYEKPAILATQSNLVLKIISELDDDFQYFKKRFGQV